MSVEKKWMRKGGRGQMGGVLALDVKGVGKIVVLVNIHFGVRSVHRFRKDKAVFLDCTFVLF